MIEIEIDGQTVKTEEGASIIEAADSVGIHIPRYCYHEKLSIAANCRMCLVEIEKTGKPLPACATPVTPDMKVYTKSKMATEAQRSVMEFLLINHPLDCPICDQGGECELQDLAMGYGDPYSKYEEPKRAVFNESLGPLIQPEMTRCIHCTRCVRFGEEVAGMRELGATGRGEDMEIGTYVKHVMQSELSGNVIDLCPVGALLAKPSLYSGRGWELQEHPAIAPHDCVGTNIFVHTKWREYSDQRSVMRVVPRRNESINETWMSDRDRFSYEGLTHTDRCFEPMIKTGSGWETISWQDALTKIATRTDAILQQLGADQIAALASPNSTLEEFYLLQKLMRALGSHNIDHRVNALDFGDQDRMSELTGQKFPGLGTNIADIEDLSAILLVGSNVRFEQPMLGHHIRKAALNNAEIFTINPVDYTFTFTVSSKVITADIISPLAEIAKILADEAGEKHDALSDVIPSDAAKHIAQRLQSSEKSAIFLGTFANHHPAAAQIRSLLRIIGRLTQSSIGIFTDGANASGAYLAGAVPHHGAAGAKLDRTGLDAKSVLMSNPVKAYFLLGLEPELDTAYPAAALQALKSADLVVCLTPFVTETMKTYADFILPIAPFSQTSGTFVNGEGTWQSFDGITEPEGESKPAWKVLRALARKLSLGGFEYKTTCDIRDALKSQLDSYQKTDSENPALGPIQTPSKDLIRLASRPMYRADSLVRRARALQDMITEDTASISMNETLAKQLGFTLGDRVTAIQKESRLSLPVMIDNRLADGIVLIPAGLEETTGFGEATATVSLEREAS